MLHILLVDPHAVFRTALAVVLARHLDLPVITQAGTVAEGQQHLLGMDLAVVDTELLDEGADLVRALRGGSSQPRVVALAPASMHEATWAALEGVADAVVSKAARLDELLDTLAPGHGGGQ